MTRAAVGVIKEKAMTSGSMPRNEIDGLVSIIKEVDHAHLAFHSLWAGAMT
jgi:hypothetical protein